MLERGITQDQLDTIQMEEQIVNDQRAEFQSLYNSLKSLNEMFKDLHALVIEQGTILDRIDYNMTVTHERMKKAHQELKAAAKHQDAGQFKLCILFIVVLIIGFTVALMVKLSS